MITLSTTSTPTWQSFGDELTQREGAKVRTHWDEFVRYTAPPGIPFEWGKWGMEESLKHWCRHHGFIVESECGRWETSKDLWMFLIHHSGEEEVGSEAVGQCRLPVDAPRETRETTDLSPRTQGSSRQITLGGDEIVNETGETDDAGRWRVNVAKGSREPTRAEQALADKRQTTLTGFDAERGYWVGPAPSDAWVLARSSGDAYS